MNEEQKKRYIESEGTICPFCDSEDLEGDSLSFFGEAEGIQHVKCCSCGKHWSDVYTLTDVRG